MPGIFLTFTVVPGFSFGTKQDYAQRHGLYREIGFHTYGWANVKDSKRFMRNPAKSRKSSSTSFNLQPAKDKTVEENQ